MTPLAKLIEPAQHRWLKLIGFQLLVLCLTPGLTDSFAWAELSVKQKTTSLRKTSTDDYYRAFTINNVFNYYSNNGEGSWNKFTGNSAFEFPKGSLKTALFIDGVLWGGFHKGRSTPTVGGSYYRHGLQAGRILTNGTGTTEPVADDPVKTIYRIFCVRPDVNPRIPLETVRNVLDDEAALISRFDSAATAQSLYDQYVKDWNEWPAKTVTDLSGLALFTDTNADGLYDPAVDIPGQPGAAQTLYFVSNDMNASRVRNLAGSPPIGLEMHRTIWGYNKDGALRSVIFVSTLLINKSGAPVDSMFLEQFADNDLGDARDDLVGCDTSRSLGYAYNSKADSIYGTAVPAVGYLLLQGPLVPGQGDSALYRQHYRAGYRNLGITAFMPLTAQTPAFAGPGEGSTADTKWYRVMNGLSSQTGNPIIDPTTGKATKLSVYGNPVTGQGWLDGTGDLVPYDRRLCFASGPFSFAPGDTQEIVVATIIAQGVDRLSSITELKTSSDDVRSFYQTGAKGGLVHSVENGENSLPQGFALQQNYPNPFNPTTTIRYALPHRSHVTLPVYNTLGQLVTTLVNSDIDAGYHQVQFNAGSLASGVYFYRMQAGNYTETRKLCVMK